MSPLRLRYQTLEFLHTDIHLRTLRDRQQFNDPLGVAEKLGISSAAWPIFGLIWPSGLVLAHFIDNYDTKQKRILEIGCGIGLSSLLLNQRNADITATDHHPEAENFLQQNIKLNSGNSIEFERTDWEADDSQLGRFDLIIGSDLLYEDHHVMLLANFIEQHANPICEVILVDPGRGRKSKFSRKMAELGYSHRHYKPINIDYLDAPFKGDILHFNR